jgi:hypothetical protein
VKIKDREVGKINFEMRKLMLWHRNDYNQAVVWRSGTKSMAE